ncbi:MAG: TetR/AcrR family transcriptional regulator [Planctomycetota bacterium]|nr:TetR/AcrR family transcriptional regulator [Planctomycetota bacterium]
MPDKDQTNVGDSLGRRARKALAARRAMFEAGLAGFERQPIGLVSVLDITEAADVAKGVFYLHFQSKDEFIIALWEDVQRTFLETVRDGAADMPSAGDRLGYVAGRYAALARENPRAARFWLRVNGYLFDEIGQPGQFGGLRQQFLQQLAAVLAGVRVEEVTQRELRTAGVLDACCWGLISRAGQLGEAPPEPERFVRIVVAAAHAAESD